jgi:hypothetical protein
MHGPYHPPRSPHFQPLIATVVCAGSSTATSLDTTTGIVLWNRGKLHLAGGNSLVPQGLALLDFSLLAGSGDVAGPLSGPPQSTIRAEEGCLALGVSNSFLRFNHAGVLEVGVNSVTLHSLGFANLGVLTTMAAGGLLTAANGIALDAGENFQGAGTIGAPSRSASARRFWPPVISRSVTPARSMDLWAKGCCVRGPIR